jgi:hypothetical protein
VVLPQVSPATRQPSSRRHASTPSATAPHWPAQQSALVSQISPATRQSGPGASHLPAEHRPEQQSAALAHVPFACTQMPPQVPAAEQPRPQHAPARLHTSPLLAQPATDAQVSWPLPSCWHRKEQQSSARWQDAPSPPHEAWLQAPSTQAPEQHASDCAQAAPSPAHEASTGALASSTSRTQALVAAAATARRPAQKRNLARISHQLCTRLDVVRASQRVRSLPAWLAAQRRPLRGLGPPHPAPAPRTLRVRPSREGMARPSAARGGLGG